MKKPFPCTCPYHHPTTHSVPQKVPVGARTPLAPAHGHRGPYTFRTWVLGKRPIESNGPRVRPLRGRLSHSKGPLSTPV
eukprot:scaffold1223_cov136-Isochrysis_galbana.AAC.10